MWLRAVKDAKNSSTLSPAEPPYNVETIISLRGASGEHRGNTHTWHVSDLNCHQLISTCSKCNIDASHIVRVSETNHLYSPITGSALWYCCKARWRISLINRKTGKLTPCKIVTLKISVQKFALVTVSETEITVQILVLIGSVGLLRK